MGPNKSLNDSLNVRRHKSANKYSVNKKSEADNLADSNNQGIHNRIFDTGLVPCFALSADCIIIEANTTFANYLGYSLSEIINSWLGNYMNSNDIQDLKNRLNIPDNEIITASYLLVHKSGKEVTSQLKGIPSKNYESEIDCYLFVVTDISNEIKSFEQLKIQNLNLKLKDELISNKEFELKKQDEELQNLNKALIDQQKKMEDLQSHIVDNELRLKSAFDAVNDGIWEWNLTDEKIFLSERFLTMLGYDGFEFPHNLNTIIKLIHPDDQDRATEIFDKIFNGKLNQYSLEYRMRKKNDEYLWILSRGKLMEKNDFSEPLRMLGTHVDISNQKKVELELKETEIELKKQNEEYFIINNKLEESNQKIKRINEYLKDKQAHLDSIMKTVPVSVGLVSEQIILFANKYTSLMTGYDIEEIIGHDALFLYPNSGEYNRVYEILFNNNSEGNIKSVNTIWKMKNGTLIDVYITVTNIDIESPAKGYTFTALDVTAQRLYEEELIKAKVSAEKAEKLKSVFLANISHELRTPMNGIVGFAELLQNQVNQASRDKYLKIIVNSSKQLLKIITDIVDISKIETGEIEIFQTPLSINKLLKEYYENYREYLDNRNKFSVELKYSSCFQDGDDKILVDENKFKHILTNILNNAVKFTDSGSICYGCELKENDVEFFVTDTGIGIGSEEKETIFERFRKTESAKSKIYGGTGLGLAIAKGFVEAMKGKIWVESEPEKGSAVYYTIPYAPICEKVVEEPEESYTSINWTDYHILVVEDDMGCLALINELLEETKIKISNAMTGLEAVKMCRKDSSIDIVLMDMRLPEMDGYEATKRIKEIRPQLSIVAQTAHALSDDKKKCTTAGCDDYLTKPIIQSILFDTISKFLAKLPK